MKLIIGAGFAGLLAAHAWPRAKVFEVREEPSRVHKALLRFRTPAVSQLTGIEFQRVTVRKGIYSRGAFVAPDIRIANWYANKVIGLSGDRSIWDIAPAERYVAPTDIYEQLLEAVGNRIEWGTKCEYSPGIVSTAPLPEALAANGLHAPFPFKSAPIYVRRWRIPDCNLYQTIYFPDPGCLLYRASITGDELIAEFCNDPYAEEPLPLLEAAFGFSLEEADPLPSGRQKFGKLAPVPDTKRKELLFQLTAQHGIYSLGRFATWRNILLDDVVNDIAVIKRIARNQTHYDTRRTLT